MTQTQPQTDVTPKRVSRPFYKRALASAGDFLRQLARRPLSFIGLMLVIGFILMAIFAPIIAPFAFDQISTGPRSSPPSIDNLFGTDRLGRDVFSRVVWGSREIIVIPGIATAIAVFFGAGLGMMTGFYGGWIDEVISRAW